MAKLSQSEYQYLKWINLISMEGEILALLTCSQYHASLCPGNICAYRVNSFHAIKY